MKRVSIHWVIVLLLIGLSGFARSELFAESEKVVARVGKRVITQSDLAEYMKRYERAGEGASFNVEQKKYFLDLLIQNVLVAAEAEKEKLDEKPEIQLKLRMYRDDLLVNEYTATQIVPSVTVTDADVEELLRQNPTLLPRETLTLKEIQVKTKKEAEEVYHALTKGADFSKMVEEKSVSPSKAKGGLVGTVQKGVLPPVLETVIFGLKEGEFTQPFEADDGFRIFYLAGRKVIGPEQMKRLEGQLREQLVQVEKSRKISAIIEKKVEQWKKEIKVETYPDQLK
jgi:parvulin-like peptidyl-prolyl isomerase